MSGQRHKIDQARIIVIGDPTIGIHNHEVKVSNLLCDLVEKEIVEEIREALRRCMADIYGTDEIKVYFKDYDYPYEDDEN